MESAGKDSSRGFLWDVYDFFCSIKLSIVVLLGLALTSIFGTVIEQGKEPGAYVQAYGEAVAQLIQILNLGDMYHSWWFLLLLALLLINITCCSVRRLPHALRLMRDRDPVFDGRPVAIHERWEGVSKALSPGDAASAAEALLSRRLGKVTRRDVEGTTYLFAARGGWSRLGVYVTHCSLFLFAVGAQVGVWGGMKGFVEVLEGESIKEVQLRGGGTAALDFEVRCDRFEVSFYLDPATGRSSGRPKDYKSWLSVVENGRTVVKKTIEVNDPLIYKGIYFYQSSYGQRGGKSASVSVYGARRNLLADRARVGKGDALDLEGGTKLRLLDLTADYRGTGPAILIELEQAGGAKSNPMIVQASEAGPTTVGEYLLRLDGMESSMYTGLQVAKDPGVPIVWAGCIMITIGLLIAFFTSHRRVWVRVRGAGRATEIFVGGNASRNRVAFEKWFGELVQDAKETFEK